MRKETEPWARLRLYFGPRLSVYRAAKALSGLAGLAEAGAIKLNVAAEDAAADVDPNVLNFDVAPLNGGAEKRVAVDLSDHHGRFYENSLEACDVYFKRSYAANDLARLPAAARDKIVPFGLNFSCATRAGRSLVLKQLLRTALPRMWSPLALAKQLGRLKSFYVLGTVDHIEQMPDVPLEPVVLLQTRVWPPEPSGETFEAVNEERVALLRRLKQAFGERFRGGLVPIDFARQHYPDLVVNQNYRHADYLRFARRALVGVYTRGLHDSLAGKMGDYLAASKCIVAHPPRAELPEPLRPGVHYRSFQAEDECVAQCDWLLSHPHEAQEMRQANHAYYRRWLRPETHLRWCVEQALAHESNRLGATNTF